MTATIYRLHTQWIVSVTSDFNDLRADFAFVSQDDAVRYASARKLRVVFA